jgi:hypothetical protein
MSQPIRDWARRHVRTVAVSFLVVGMLLSAVFLPRSAQNMAVGGLVVAMGAFYAWATTTLPRRPPTEPSPPLTIGDTLKRRRTLLVRIMVPVMIAWTVAVLWYPSTLTKMQKQLVAVGGSVVLFWILWFPLRQNFRCPRCGTDFKMERRAKLGRISFDQRGPEEIWDKCPNCGVSFNEPWTNP